MKVTTKLRYRLRAMIELALNEGEVVLVKDIAEREGISRKYLDSLLAELKNAGLVRSIRGAKGGYTLAKPSDQISIDEIACALEGAPNLVDCVEDPSFCSRYEICIANEFWKSLSEVMQNFLKKTTLAELAKKARQKQEQVAHMYYI